MACDHYARYREDIAQLASLHQNAHRFSVEWARVEPQPGWFDAAALRHYADVARTCRAHGIEPVVTLHHFTMPRWFADGGGVRRADAPRLFARYAAACAEALGEHVTWWVTINEPSVLAVVGHLQGRWPPGERSLAACVGVLRGLLRMHAAATRALRSVAAVHARTALVSVAHHERRFRPSEPARWRDRVAAALPDYIFNRWFLRCCASGRLLPPLGAGETVPGLHDSLDYIGLNYYCEERVRFDRHATQSLFTTPVPDPSLPVSSFGCSIGRTAIETELLHLWQQFRLPLLVTENGAADVDDELRPGYLIEHLRAILEAIDDGVDVRGYLHWTAWDNFEWAEGFTQRFGLFAVDPHTQDRIAKPSAAVYAEICRTRTLPDPDAVGVPSRRP